MDIFEFWHEVGAAERIHPADRTVFDRLPKGTHGFQLDCLPGPFKGPLRTAPIVLLFLSPGFKPIDRIHAAKPEGQAYYARSRTGNALLPLKEDHPASYEWSARVLRQFGVRYEEVRKKVAFLNIGAYKSKHFDSWPMLVALPSCRMAIGWAQKVLFPEAEAGRRVVVCLRSARYWGLQASHLYAGNLFAPEHTRTGTMVLGPERERIVEAVQRAVEAVHD